MHIGTNPRKEALELHIQQQRLVERIAVWREANPFVIWDIGLGPAGNALTLLESLRDSLAPVELHSFEISTDVLEFALRHSEALEYLSGWEGVMIELLEKGVATPLPNVRWELHRGDFTRQPHPHSAPSAIFFDPYSTTRNIEMWNLENFQSIHHAVSAPDAPACLMTNYTRSTAVRVTMALAGWYVGKGVSTGDKTETTIVSNRLDFLECPLGHEWIKRVHSSSNAAPIRGRNEERGPISEEDFARLISLRQFQS
jgi:tRNA U34 5-methylaminomethyl-2-thiouridine-forming methyltransferase MnmC